MAEHQSTTGVPTKKQTQVGTAGGTATADAGKAKANSKKASTDADEVRNDAGRTLKEETDHIAAQAASDAHIPNVGALYVPSLNVSMRMSCKAQHTVVKTKQVVNCAVIRQQDQHVARSKKDIKYSVY